MSEEQAGSGVDEEMEGVRGQPQPAGGMTEEEIHECLNGGDVRRVHMAIWTELGILDDQSPMPPMPQSRNTADNTVESNVGDEVSSNNLTEQNINALERAMSLGEVSNDGRSQVHTTSSSGGRSSIQDWVNETESHLTSPMNQSTPAIDREDLPFSTRWENMLRALADHPTWGRAVHDLDRTSRVCDEIWVWNAVQETLDAYEKNYLDQI